MTARAVRSAILVLVVALVGTACGSSGGTRAPATSAGAGPPAGSRASGTASAGPPSSDTAALDGARRAVSRSDRPLAVRAGPSVSAKVVTRLSPRTPLGSVRVLLVERASAGWVKVALPVRPNGSSGWVAAADVRIEPVRDVVAVNLSSRRLTLRVKGVNVADAPVAIGAPADPTPVGTFFVTDRVRPPDPGGAYGAFALGLSAHSDTISEFGSGDGQIGIHGTNEPGSIGKAVSHGCIRVPAEAASMLARVPLGTPVVIDA